MLIGLRRSLSFGILNWILGLISLYDFALTAVIADIKDVGDSCISSFVAHDPKNFSF